jgi:hypothetical protein
MTFRLLNQCGANVFTSALKSNQLVLSQSFFLKNFDASPNFATEPHDCPTLWGALLFISFAHEIGDPADHFIVELDPIFLGHLDFVQAIQKVCCRIW